MRYWKKEYSVITSVRGSINVEISGLLQIMLCAFCNVLPGKHDRKGTWDDVQATAENRDLVFLLI